MARRASDRGSRPSPPRAPARLQRAPAVGDQVPRPVARRRRAARAGERDARAGNDPRPRNFQRVLSSQSRRCPRRSRRRPRRRRRQAPRRKRRHRARRSHGRGDTAFGSHRTGSCDARGRGPTSWRAGLVGICYFGLLCGFDLLGLYSYSSAVLPGVVAGALAWRLSYPRRRPGCFTSLVAVVLAHGAFVAMVIFGGSVDDYLASLIDYPEEHIRHISFGVGGFLIAWVLLGAFQRTFRHRRSGGAGA